MNNFETASAITDIADGLEAFKLKHKTALDEVAGRVDSMELNWKRRSRHSVDVETKGTEALIMKKWLSGKELEPIERKALSISADGQDVTVRDDWDMNLMSRMFDTSGLNGTKESELGFRSGFLCASHADAHRNFFQGLRQGSIPA